MSTSRCSTAFTDPEIPDQIASWMFSITSSGSGLADVLDCSFWLKYRSSTGGPPFPRLSRRLEGNHPLMFYRWISTTFVTLPGSTRSPTER